ncbi:MAG: chromosome segregation protein SMC [Eubacteriales bacterium]|nr:chromosome segregation protein SMC [Eubacteriales bacterium]
MYLKSIEIHGFKSFANKIVFEFPHGITGIVGPNGSGKSNIGDAVRWVLGEQSAKQLRGAKMEDVIFSGTQNRKPLGFAYVSIVFDNRSRKIALDYDEVKVARRVYRSGESEYLLNGATCRRRDIVEIFYDTGIGKEGYSIIGQGQVEKILSGKIEDSRELFDEAAGIAKYKKNRAVTEKSLEQEHQNLERVTDVLSELADRVGPLEEESRRAKEYLRLKEKEKELDIHLFLYDYESGQRELAERRRQLSIVEDSRKEAEASCAAVRQKNQRLREDGERLSEKLSRLEEEKEGLLKEKEAFDSQKMVLRHQMDSNQRMATHYGEIIRQNLSDRTKREEEWRQQEALYQEEKEKREALVAQREKTTARKKNLEAQKKILSQKLEERKDALFSSMDDQLDTKEKLSRYDTMEEQLVIRNAEYNSRLIGLQSDWKDYEAKKAELEEELERAREAYHKSADRTATLRRSRQDVQDSLEQVKEKLEQDNQTFVKARSRYETLAGVAERYDGYNQSIRHIMEQKKRHPGIIGVVADILTMDRRYETAIEIALGGALQNVVTEDDQVAKQMIAWLKQNRRGRATFLPLPNIRKRNRGIHPSILEEEGVVGVASSLVTVEPRFDALVQSLLGNTVVADTVENALRLSKKNNYTLRIVTLEGELLNPGGSITGGAYRHSGNLLGRKREMEESRAQMEQARRSCQALQQQIQTLQEKAKAGEERLSLSKKEEDGLQLKLHDLGYRIPELLDKEKELKHTIRILKEEHGILQEQLSEIQKEKEILAKSQRSHEKLHEKNNDALESLEKEIFELKEQLRQMEQTENEQTLNISRVEQQMEFYQKDVLRLKEEERQCVRSIRRNEEEQEKLEGQNKEAEQQILAMEAGLSETFRKLHLLSRKVEEKKAQQTKISEEQNRMFQELEEQNEHRVQLEKESGRLQSRIERLESDTETAVDYMWDAYELTYHYAKECKRFEIREPEAEKYRQEKKEVTKKLRQLGSVNVNAIEEFQTVGERYEFLRGQYEDIREAEEKLGQMIFDLNEAMQEQFTQSFQKIRETFAAVFQDLFEGGTADLELMDEAQMLECGVRIVAQPPGKKLQNIMLLSGGERALTAIALLFAIQKLKPSPFCLLDEIEAALDDANILRFSKYLKKLSEDTQFIVITHRRGTMNAAEALYGITMQEKGISTLISVDLIDKELDA